MNLGNRQTQSKRHEGAGGINKWLMITLILQIIHPHLSFLLFKMSVIAAHSSSRGIIPYVAWCNNPAPVAFHLQTTEQRAAKQGKIQQIRVSNSASELHYEALVGYAILDHCLHHCLDLTSAAALSLRNFWLSLYSRHNLVNISLTPLVVSTWMRR